MFNEFTYSFIFEIKASYTFFNKHVFKNATSLIFYFYDSLSNFANIFIIGDVFNKICIYVENVYISVLILFFILFILFINYFKLKKLPAHGSSVYPRVAAV